MSGASILPERAGCSGTRSDDIGTIVAGCEPSGSGTGASVAGWCAPPVSCEGRDMLSEEAPPFLPSADPPYIRRATSRTEVVTNSTIISFCELIFIFSVCV